ncbi:MAG: gamma carbonic anhydrase family protein [Cyanobacteria bacterium P01_H01_bin.130]
MHHPLDQTTLPVPDLSVLPDMSGAVFVAQTATVVGLVTVGQGVSVWYGAVVRGDVERIELGDWCNVQDGAVIHGDPGIPTVLESHVTVGHRAVIHSAHIERGCIIGMGALVLLGVRGGAASVIGAGAVVTKDVPPSSLVVGVPGKVMRSLDEAALDEAIAHAEQYAALGSHHAQRAPKS